jgi:hypothetical protein
MGFLLISLHLQVASIPYPETPFLIITPRGKNQANDPPPSEKGVSKTFHAAGAVEWEGLGAMDKMK